MALPFGFYRSPGATRRSLRFETRRTQMLEVAEPLAIQAALARFREVEADLQPRTEPSVFDEIGISRGQRALRERDVRAVPAPTREPGIPSFIEDVFRQVGRVAGGPGLEDAFLPENLGGGLAPPIPPQLVSVENRMANRYAELLEETRRSAPALLPRDIEREALERLEEEFGDELRATERAKRLRELQERDDRLLIGEGRKGLFGVELGKEALKGLGAGIEFLETKELGGGPFFRDPRTGKTGFEEGAEISRPIVQAVQPIVAEPFEQVEAAGIPVVSPVSGGVASAIESKIVEDIATEVINPAALVLVAPVALAAASGLRGVAAAEVLVSNLLGTGLEPTLVRGTLRGLTILGREGLAGLSKLSKVVRETPIIQDALRGLLEAPEAGGRVPGGSRFRPRTPEGVRLTNDIPATSAIDRQLADIDARLAKPKVKGGRKSLLEERAKLQAQQDIDEITTSGRPVAEQLDEINLELETLQTELSTRAVPFRGKFRMGKEFIRTEKESRLGLPSAEELAGRPSASVRRETADAIARNRFPDMSARELNAREQVFREFANNARFEPVEAGAAEVPGALPGGETVRQAEFTQSGQVVERPRFATEGELAGARPSQGELGIGAGERPIETAGPLFERPVPATGPARGGEGPPPPRRPTAAGGLPPDEGGRIPSLREVEADAFPKFTPEERARFVPETTGVYSPDDFEAVGTRILSGADETVLRFAEKIIKVPGVKQIVGAVNRIAEARGNPILMARIKNGIFKAIEGNRVNLAVTRWKKGMLDAFDWGPDWTAQVSLKPGVKGVPKKAQGHIEDLLVHTDDYVLTDAQRVTLDHGRGLRDNMLQQQLANGVDVLPVQGEYMRRIVRATPEGQVRNGVVPRGGRIGGRKGSQKPRSFKDIRDGFRAGYDYERDPFSLMNLRLHEGVTTIADKRALKLVAAEGETLAERVPMHIREEAVASRQRLVEARKVASKKGATEADKLAWEVARRDHIQARKVWIEVRRRVHEPSWGEVRGPGNRIFDEQFAKELTEWAGSGTESVIQQANLLVRAFKTTLDFSATGVQLGITMLTHPIVWAKSSIRGVLSSMADPLTWAHANYEALDEGIRFGAIARPTEFLFADAGIASIPTRIPFVGSLFRGSNRAFQWAIIQAQTELWKIHRAGLTSQADLASAAASIRKQTGALEMAALGLGSKQHALESTAAFAARFFRANVGLLTDLGMRGPRGRIARSTLGRFVVAGTTLTIGGHMALNGGKMPNLTDPNKPGWFKIRVSEDNYISLFGPMYPFMRLLAQDADLLARGKITEIHRPLQFFITSKAGIPYRTAYDLYLASRGRETNVFGDRLPTDPLSAAEFTARQFAPIGPEQAAEGLARGQPEALAEVGGFNVTPISPFGKLLEAWNEVRGTGNIPDRPFNFETDFNTAEQDERLAPLVQAVHERSRRRGTEGAQRAERISAVRLELEDRLDLPLLAQGITEDKPRAASEFAFAWDDYTQQMVGVFASEYLGVESNRQTEEGRLLQAYQQIEMRDFRDPETLEVDRDAFFAAKDAAFAALPLDLQLSIENNIRSENPTVQEAETQIKEAKRLRSEFYEMPKYLDPGKSDEEMLEYEKRLAEFMAFVVQELARAKREFGEDFSLSRPEAAIILGQRDFGDKQLGEDAALIFRGKVKRNPERLQFLDTHQDVLARFFPNLYRLKAAREALSDELFEAVIQ